VKQDTLLVELGTEELPPKALKQLSESFKHGIEEGLNKAELAFGEIKALATPRRLAVLVNSLEGQQQDKVVEKRGPSVDVAFDEAGQPTKAAQGWARSNGIEVSEAERLETDKGAWLLHKAEVKGESLAQVLPGIVEDALKKLPIPKPMRWGDSDAQFIRPVHTLTLLFGDELINASLLGIKSGRHINAHRFHAPDGFDIQHADDYEAQLYKHHVIADQAKRMELIRTSINDLASQLGGTVETDEDLVEEVSALVEWPVALSASFDEQFLTVPKEALIVTMKDDQRYFPVQDDKGELKPVFIFITNIDSKDPKQIIKGNERVVRPRLADAQFFFESDKKVTLSSRLDKLGTVLFQKQLGTMKDKSERISRLSARIAGSLNADEQHARLAGELCKTDLVTDMVSEFPETQGVMGRHYALNDGLDAEVADAIEQHYWPRFAGDNLPTSDVSRSVALADKLDSLVGIFGIGQTPKGDRDPFALRRAALGLIRIIVESNLNLDLYELIDAAIGEFGDRLSNNDVRENVFNFIIGRFRPWYQEQGISVDVIQAVLARAPSRPADFNLRIHAVDAFKQHDAAESLSAANKRVGNILSKSEGDLTGKIDHTLLVAAEEKTLAAQISETEKSAEPEIAAGNYEGALTRMASLKSPIDDFFENVMVNDEDPAVRQNRLNLLYQLRGMFLRVADISLLQ
jgi:glycyl-tRNA synthetase beta chain